MFTRGLPHLIRFKSAFARVPDSLLKEPERRAVLELRVSNTIQKLNAERAKVDDLCWLLYATSAGNLLGAYYVTFLPAIGVACGVLSATSFAAGSWGVLELKKLQGKVEDAEYLHKRNIAGDDVESLEKLLEEIETQI